ncbi:marine proteobacterial sortase target protein [Marinobacter sp. M-5]|uniref:marine proteobacterial sortase target protein n=1 Tax=Marinobacter sp. M-5 TaxID=3081089 RepID=UPI00293C4654|nr:marine proteobacterial sortase target protein [Marinobacter sp. M-5]MDV3502219.1 marine proteobacterial sortase target protein [Marinobacter sp. M-5]
MMLPTTLLRLELDKPRLAPRRVKRCCEGVSLWLAMLLLLFVHPLYAEAASAAEGTGMLEFVAADGRHQGQATLLNTEYQVRVSGLIADTRLTQSFRNTSQQWREGVFVFPLPEKASVYGMTMRVGEREIVGDVREKQEAKRRYEAAKKAGKNAARVDQQRPNLFTTHLANIPPGETITVELNYQQTVRYQSGEFELRLPTTLTPRYMPGEPLAQSPQQWQGGWARPTTAVPDADAISPSTVQAEDVGDQSHRVVVNLEIDAGLPVADVASPSHALRSTWDGHRVRVAPEQGAVPMDQDVVVRWSPVRGQAPSAAVFHERWQGEDYLLALLVPGLSRNQNLPRELVFVIDTSGSMAGQSIGQARASLLRGLATLSPGDRFNIIQFNSQTHALFMQAVPANGQNLARARRYVEGLSANGGTEMAPALRVALGENSPEEETTGQHVRQVVFITDGAVGNEAALFEQIRQQLGGRRLFTVGIGSAPNLHFMREAARYGRGSYTAISDIADVAGQLDDLFAKMQAPVLTDIAIELPPAAGPAEAYPIRPGDLFAGEPLVQVMRGVKSSGSLGISGRLSDGSRWQTSLDLSRAASGTGLHRHWGREKIDSLMDQTLSGHVGDESRQQVVELALAHQLITRFTSFVAVDSTPVRETSEPLTTDQVPTLLPAGSSSTMLRYPQTATLSPLLTALGLLGLMFSAAGWMLQRRVSR